MTDIWPVVAFWAAALAYIAVVMFVIRCFLLKRCMGMDEHAMIPGDERLTDVAREVEK